jgi:MFS family permease
MTILIAVAVALAFADSSIVVLGLPEVYGEFDETIVGVSWVITTYNLAVLIGAGALALRSPRRPRPLTVVGLVVFAAASMACALAPSFPALIAGRVAQGIGGACLLSGALPLLAASTGSPERARALWAGAAAIGVAAGPALGGVLTGLASWRSIFAVQAPIAVVALAAAVRLRTDPAPVAELATNRSQKRLQIVASSGAFALLFAGLVGALFLAVLLFVVVWGDSPIEGALVVSVLAVATLVAAPVARAVPPAIAALTGGWLFAAGLLGLAWLPLSSPRYAAVALWFCGFGFGLLNAVLHHTAVPPGATLGRTAASVVAAKHAGFVLGLLAIAPVLAGDLDSATREATRASAAIVLDAPFSIRVKVPIAIDLARLVQDTPRGEVPDVQAPFDERVARDADVAPVRDELTTAIEATITRSFRASFVLAALFAGGAGIVAAAASAAESMSAA